MNTVVAIVCVIVYIVFASKQDMKRRHQEWLDEQHDTCHCQPRKVSNKIHGRYLHKDEEPLQ